MKINTEPKRIKMQVDYLKDKEEMSKFLLKHQEKIENGLKENVVIELNFENNCKRKYICIKEYSLDYIGLRLILCEIGEHCVKVEISTNIAENMYRVWYEVEYSPKAVALKELEESFHRIRKIICKLNIEKNGGAEYTLQELKSDVRAVNHSLTDLNYIIDNAITGD